MRYCNVLYHINEPCKAGHKITRWFSSSNKRGILRLTIYWNSYTFRLPTSSTPDASSVGWGTFPSLCFRCRIRTRQLLILCPGLKSSNMLDSFEVLKIDITVEGVMFVGNSYRNRVKRLLRISLVILCVFWAIRKHSSQNTECSDWAPEII